MKKEDLKNKILDVIREKEISPKPKWHFLVKDYSVWFFGIVSVLIGGVASSVVIFVLINGDWMSYRFLSDSLLEHTIKVAPYYWLLFLGIFILVADYNFKNTKEGYRYSVPKIVGLSILTSIILGLIFYSVGLAHITDYALSNRLPGYHRLNDIKKEMWNNPETGLLAGTVIPSERSDVLIVEDFDGNRWEVSISNLMPMHFIILDNVERVVFSGKFIDKGHFEACAVKPWELKGESPYIREKMFEQMEQSGMHIPSNYGSVGGGMMRRGLQDENLDERNIFWMRINNCGSPAGPKITN